jgi:hypothetical protein
LNGVGKLASGRGHVHQIEQHQIRAEVGFVRHQRSGWSNGNVPFCLAEALRVCVRIGVRNRLKGNPELRGYELTDIDSNTPIRFPSGARFTNSGLPPFIATRNFPSDASSELIVDCPRAAPGNEVSISNIASNKIRRMDPSWLSLPARYTKGCRIELNDLQINSAEDRID